jgi:hypothetical protein
MYSTKFSHRYKASYLSVEKKNQHKGEMPNCVHNASSRRRGNLLTHAFLSLDAAFGRSSENIYQASLLLVAMM